MDGFVDHVGMIEFHCVSRISRPGFGLRPGQIDDHTFSWPTEHHGAGDVLLPLNSLSYLVQMSR